MEFRSFSPRSFNPLGWAVGASALAHALILAAILLRLDVEMPAEPPAEPSIELRLVETQGAGPANEARPPQPPEQASPRPAETPPSPAAAAEPPPEPLPMPPPAPPERPAQAAPSLPRPTSPRSAETAPPPPPPAEAAAPLPEPLPMRPPTPPERPAQAAPPQPRPAAPAGPPELNLGGGDDLTNALASGPAVVPARIDARFRNREPVYPPSAARRGERGTVMLSIHVGPDGAVAGIDVADSSGFILLDRAARDAVATWHFLPAVRDGRPLAADMKLRVVFQLN